MDRNLDLDAGRAGLAEHLDDPANGLRLPGRLRRDLG